MKKFMKIAVLALATVFVAVGSVEMLEARTEKQKTRGVARRTARRTARRHERHHDKKEKKAEAAPAASEAPVAPAAPADPMAAEGMNGEAP